MKKKDITSPLSKATSKKEHILDLRRYYTSLREFLSKMIHDPTELQNGSAVLFPDCLPLKDELVNLTSSWVVSELDFSGTPLLLGHEKENHSPPFSQLLPSQT